MCPQLEQGIMGQYDTIQCISILGDYQIRRNLTHFKPRHYCGKTINFQILHPVVEIETFARGIPSSEVLKNYFCLQCIQNIWEMAFHSQSNGMVKEFCRTLEEHLLKVVDES